MIATPGGQGGELPLRVCDVIRNARAVGVALGFGVPRQAHGFGLVDFRGRKGGQLIPFDLLSERFRLDGACFVWSEEGRIEVGVVDPDAGGVATSGGNSYCSRGGCDAAHDTGSPRRGCSGGHRCRCPNGARRLALPGVNLDKCT